MLYAAVKRADPHQHMAQTGKSKEPERMVGNLAKENEL